MIDTKPANLFAAARSYARAMKLLYPEFEASGDVGAAIAMPFYLLAGFAIELSLKAIILRTTGDHAGLKAIGHDLQKADTLAGRCGLKSDDSGLFAKLVNRMNPVHRGLVARYVPDVEIINLPGPGLVLTIIADHLSRCEAQFDVWEDGS